MTHVAINFFIDANDFRFAFADTQQFHQRFDGNTLQKKTPIWLIDVLFRFHRLYIVDSVSFTSKS